MNASELVAQLAMGEPTLSEVQLAAEGATSGSNKLDRLATRAGYSALAPRLEASWEKTDSLVERLLGTPFESAISGNRYGVRVSWDLTRFVFNPEEVQLLRIEFQLARGRTGTRQLVAQIYFERQQHRLAMLIDPPSTPQDKAKRQLELVHITGILDAFTAGFFSRRLGELREEPKGKETMKQAEAPQRSPLIQEDSDDDQPEE